MLLLMMLLMNDCSSEIGNIEETNQKGTRIGLWLYSYNPER